MSFKMGFMTRLLGQIGLLTACLTLAGCGGMSGGSAAAPLPAAVDSGAPAAAVASTGDVMRIGDKITIRLSGVPDEANEGYIIEVQIPPSGNVTVPLLTQTFPAVGRTAGDLAADITQAYKTQRIYTAPNVTVVPEERYVNVGGDVRQPSRVVYTPDLTMLGAINACGGFTDYANRKVVRVLRGQQVMQVDAVKAEHTPGADPILYPGDQIYVPRTMF
jgi:protein involved in polysaccharide export with SLBB domain